MDARQLTAVIAIAVPIVFNVAFFELGRAFDYPSILRQPTAEVLTRFAAGGTRLIAVWYVASRALGENKGVTSVPAIGDFVSLAPSVIANAAAVAASRARTTAVDRTRATPGDCTEA